MTERPLGDYWNTKPVPSKRFNADLEGFSDVVWKEWRREEATGQFDLWQEIWWRRNKRLIPDKQEHLQRPTQEEIRHRNGRNKIV